MKERIKAALRGDPDAAAECTAAEIAIPCPFCGSEAKLVKINKKGYKGECIVFVRCTGCGCKTQTEYPMPHFSLIARIQAVRECWNRRVKMED